MCISPLFIICKKRSDIMKKHNKTVDLILYILSAEVIGMSSGLLAGSFEDFFEKYREPPLLPPSWLFPVVWSILYALMGIGAARISLSFPSRERTQALGIYWVQLGVNFLWSIVFFNLQWFVFSFFWLLRTCSSSFNSFSFCASPCSKRSAI